MKFCPNCGAQLPEGGKFCASCGYAVAEAPAQQPVYTAPAYEAPVQQPVYEQPVYTAPVYEQPVYEQPVYEQPAYNYGAPQMPPQGAQPGKKAKKGGKKGLVIGIIALVLVAIAAGAIVLFGGGAGEEVDESLLGVYETVECLVDGEEADPEDYWIELKNKGKAVVCLDGEETDAKWSLDGRDFVLKLDGEEYEGTLKKGKLTITIEDVEMTLELAAEDEEEEDEEEEEGKDEGEDAGEEGDSQTSEGAAVAGPAEGPSEGPVEGAVDISNDVGYWTMIRIESSDPDYNVPEDVMTAMRDAGIIAYMELFEDGTGVLMLMGEDGDDALEFTWVPGELTAGDGSSVYYYIEGDNLFLDIEGMTAVFVRGEIAPNPSAPSNPAQSVTESANKYDWWAGDWYGWWIMNEGTGVYADYKGHYWDACATIEVDGDMGYVKMWDVDCDPGQTFCWANVHFENEGAHGAMVSDEGYIYDGFIEAGEWYVLPEAELTAKYDGMITVQGLYVDPSNPDDTFYYMIFLCPWGRDWSDIRDGDNSDQYYSDMMPADYDDWYLPLAQSGCAMPGSFEEGWEMIAAGGFTQSDAGHWDLLRINSSDPGSSIDEDTIAVARDAGVMAYLELNYDGTGVLMLMSTDGDDGLEFTWVPGKLTAGDGSTVTYYVDGGYLYLTIGDMELVFIRG